MTKLNQDFTMFQGEDKQIRVPVTDSDGDPVDMGSFTTVTWLLFTNKAATAATLTKQTGGSGITVISINDTNDGVQILLETDDTHEVAKGTYYHECRGIDGAGNEGVLFEGSLNLKQSKTND